MTSQNIEELVDKALSICREQRFAESSVHGKHKIFKAVIRKHKEKGFDTYNESVLSEYIQEHKDRFEKGLMVKDAFTFKEKTVLRKYMLERSKELRLNSICHTKTWFIGQIHYDLFCCGCISARLFSAYV